MGHAEYPHENGVDCEDSEYETKAEYADRMAEAAYKDRPIPDDALELDMFVREEIDAIKPFTACPGTMITFVMRDGVWRLDAVQP